jgi:hypothetical protein
MVDYLRTSPSSRVHTYVKGRRNRKEKDAAFARIGPGILLAVQTFAEPLEDLCDYGSEWRTELPWGEGATWECMHGVVGGQVVLMWLPATRGWKLMWTEDSDRLVCTMWAFEGEQVKPQIGTADLRGLVDFWGPSRRAVPESMPTGASRYTEQGRPLGQASKPHPFCSTH